VFVRKEDTSHILRQVQDIYQSAAVSRCGGIGRLGLGESKRSRGDTGGRACTEGLKAKVLAISREEAGLHQGLNQDRALGVNQTSAL